MDDGDFDTDDEPLFDYNSKWYNSDFAADLGKGLLILLICLGVGTCTMLSNSSF